jgi:hypothetical protein
MGARNADIPFLPNTPGKVRFLGERVGDPALHDKR